MERRDFAPYPRCVYRGEEMRLLQSDAELLALGRGWFTSPDPERAEEAEPAVGWPPPKPVPPPVAAAEQTPAITSEPRARRKG